jgi:hypothetical protein
MFLKVLPPQKLLHLKGSVAFDVTRKLCLLALLARRRDQLFQVTMTCKANLSLINLLAEYLPRLFILCQWIVFINREKNPLCRSVSWLLPPYLKQKDLLCRLLWLSSGFTVDLRWRRLWSSRLLGRDNDPSNGNKRVAGHGMRWLIQRYEA